MEVNLNPSQLSTRLQEIVSSFVSLSTHVEERIELLREKENHLEETKKKIEESITKADNQIDLNVGGMRLSASKSTLLAIEGSYFHAMLSSDRWKPNNKGEYFIDRDFTHFPRILNYLRTGELELKGLDEIEMEKLNGELDYYQITPLIQQPQTPVQPIEPFQWDPNKKGRAITLSGDGRSARCINASGSGVVLATRPVPSCSIKIFAFGLGLDIGWVSQMFNVDTDKLKSGGWCLDHGGSLYSQANPNGRPYGKDFKIGDIVTMHHNRRNRTISFSVDGEDQGIAFRDVPSDVELYPSVRLGYGCFVRIVD
eukprot:TRINITY_DN1587_c0_g1_i2.p1 TRINITY_DN1587_c0_g1~~TRINITY_DN1587_c0_g1_i2.p1  ORF type:complete len:312 (-),score=76.28 TRINITY_DN1587_c0_g1_i2:114-1049(-)